MLRSMNAAVSAVKANQTKLDVTANNIANVNTIGFKKDRVVFDTMLTQAMRTAAAPMGGLGGINPSSVGMGVKVSSIDKLFTQGMLSNTGRGLDVAIQGTGFFTVTDGTNTYYTRNGSFILSPLDGSLVMSNGMKVMGYPVREDGIPDKNAGLGPVKLPSMQDTIAEATSIVNFASNISSQLAVGETVELPFHVYDSLGSKHELKMSIEVTGTGEASWTVTSNAGYNVTNGTGTLEFGLDGKLINKTGGPIEFTPIGAAPVNVDLDFNKVTMLDKTSDMVMKSQNGMPTGTVQGITIAEGGVVRATYSNGMTKDIAYLGMAIFDNPEGLEATQDSLFSASTNSGLPSVVVGNENTASRVVSGFLEGSNVDISQELTDMITTQRSYQMATKVITVSDEILQDLMSVKR